MPRPRNRDRRIVEVIEAPSASSAMIEKILLSLKPDREITAGEFLKRAFTFSQIDRIKIQKYSVGTWNFAEDLANIGTEFDPNNIETYLREKFGPWRFRLLAVMGGEVITQHVINLDGWQESEARATATAGSKGPMLTSNSKAVGPGASTELLQVARERLEIENTNRLLAGLSGGNNGPNMMDGPMRMVMESMTGMMTMFREMMQIQRGGMSQPQEDRFQSFLLEEVRYLRDSLKTPSAQRDPDTLMKTITTIDQLLQTTLQTSLGEMLTGATKTEASGWAATIQGVIEGIKPHLPELLAVMQAGAVRPQFPAGPAKVIPIRPPQPEMVPSQPEGAQDMAKLSAQYTEVIGLFYTALKEKDFDTLDTLLTNPPLLGQVNINPNANPKTYAVMLSTVDPRFRALETEIGAYLQHMRDEIAKAEAEDATTTE